MAAKKVAKARKARFASGDRHRTLKTMLEEMRRRTSSDLSSYESDQKGRERRTSEPGDKAEAGIQDDIIFALMVMKGETLEKIDDAIKRLNQGTYGDCFRCGDGISAARLSALPFAVRCKECEEARETAEALERAARQRSGSSSLFF